MWREIVNENDIKQFMQKVDYFHDSCIKEIAYLSGAYVDDNLSMYPINDYRTLKVIIQRQADELSMIELQFERLKYLKLVPIDDRYTCEIHDSTMLIKEEYIYWCDCGQLTGCDLEKYNGTIVAASKLKWRYIDKCMGNQEFFVARK